MDAVSPDEFDRVGKALVDASGMSPSEALERLKSVHVEVQVDRTLAQSPTLQAALLTLVNLTPRIFKRPALVVDPLGVLEAPSLIPSPVSTLRLAVEDLGGVTSTVSRGGHGIVLGGGDGPGLRLSFDGWNCKVGPAEWSPPLAQQERCVLAGVAGAALALSELFLASTGFTVEATKREVAFSLWAPQALVDSATEPGPELEYLPGEAWLLGLGHLGQGVAWALSMLPYADPSKLELLLQDFDRVIPANIGTQALTRDRDVGSRKTRVCAEFLRQRGFDPGVVDRPFEVGSPRHLDEPGLAIAGFDGTGPRHILDTVNFERVIVCGVGGTIDSFDDTQIHTLPLQERTAKELWPPATKSTVTQALAKENRFYQAYAEKHRCGELALAGVSVAAPFVGAFTGALAWAAVLREFHGGGRSAFLGIPLRCLEERRVRGLETKAEPPRYSRPSLPVRPLARAPVPGAAKNR